MRRKTQQKNDGFDIGLVSSPSQSSDLFASDDHTPIPGGTNGTDDTTNGNTNGNTNGTEDFSKLRFEHLVEEEEADFIKESSDF